jgi:hypothetical protein
VVIALIVTPDGFPPAYEVLPGKADGTTRRDALRKIEAQYGKADRIWIMLCAALSYVELAARGLIFRGHLPEALYIKERVAN